MEEILKNVLFYISLISGSVMLICLFIIGTIRLIGFSIDHLKIGSVMRECLMIYIKQKRPDLKVKKEDISFGKGRIKKNE